MRASVWGAAPELQRRGARERPTGTEVRPVVFDGEPVATCVLRGELAPGARIGPGAVRAARGDAARPARLVRAGSTSRGPSALVAAE